MFKTLGACALICLGAIGLGRALVRAPAKESAAKETHARTLVPPSGSKVVPQGPQFVSLAADASGHFFADFKINGMFVKGLVDTGATSVAIPMEQAHKIGINPSSADYTARIQTANGETRGAVVRLAELRLDSIVVRDVEAVVVEKGLGVTLIGMSFIRKLQSSEMRGNMLVLRQ